jgi:hypothetical protein
LGDTRSGNISVIREADMNVRAGALFLFFMELK